MFPAAFTRGNRACFWKAKFLSLETQRIENHQVLIQEEHKASLWLWWWQKFLNWPGPFFFFFSVSENLKLFPYLEYHNMCLFYIYLHKVFFFFIQVSLLDISKEKHMQVHINRFLHFMKKMWVLACAKVMIVGCSGYLCPHLKSELYPDPKIK